LGRPSSTRRSESRRLICFELTTMLILFILLEESIAPWPPEVNSSNCTSSCHVKTEERSFDRMKMDRIDSMAFQTRCSACPCVRRPDARCKGPTLHRKGVGGVFAVFFVSSCRGGSIASKPSTQSHSVRLCHLWTRIRHSGRFGDLAAERVARSAGRSSCFELARNCERRGCALPLAAGAVLHSTESRGDGEDVGRNRDRAKVRSLDPADA